MRYLRRWNESKESYSDICDYIWDIFAFKVDEESFSVYFTKTADPRLCIASISKNLASDYYFHVEDLEGELRRLVGYLGGRLVGFGPLYVGDPQRGSVADWRELGGDEIWELAVYFRV